MAARGSKRRTGGRWMMWAFWAAGASLLLVELNAGMAYLEAGLRQYAASLMGWAPSLGMMTLRVAGQSVIHWETVAYALRALPMGVLGIALVGLAVAAHKQLRNSRRQNAKQ